MPFYEKKNETHIRSMYDLSHFERPVVIHLTKGLKILRLNVMGSELTAR